MAERIMFYKVDGTEKRSVYPIDAPPFLQSSNWTTNPPSSKTVPFKPPTQSPASPLSPTPAPPPTPKQSVKPLTTRVTRQNELQAIAAKDQGWREIKDIAESLGIVKPSTGWDDAISLILDKEFPSS